MGLRNLREASLTETELQSYLSGAAVLGLVEDGLTPIDTEFRVQKGGSARGRIDILACDSSKRLVVVELKVVEEDDALWQALEYYDWIIRNADTVPRMYAKHAKRIDATASPRIVLIAPSFSERVRRIVSYIDAEISLLTYRFYEIGENSEEVGLIFNDVPPDAPPALAPTPKNIAEHLDYCTIPAVRKVMDALVNRAGELEHAGVVPRQQYVKFEHKAGGGAFAWIWVHKKKFYFSTTSAERQQFEEDDCRDENIVKTLLDEFDSAFQTVSG